MSGTHPRTVALALTLIALLGLGSSPGLSAAPDNNAGWPCVPGQTELGSSPSGSPICSTVIRAIGQGLPATPYHRWGAISRPAIAIGVDGNPLVAFSGPSSSDYERLRVVACGNRGCTADNVVTDHGNPGLDSGWAPQDTNTGHKPSMAVLPIGLPVIASHDAIWGVLRMTICLTTNCDIATSPYTLDDLGPAAARNGVGRDSSLALGADGFPVISSVAHLTPETRAPYGQLRVTHCGDPYCSGSFTTTALTPGAYDDEGWESKLAVGADGRPVIAHLSNDKVAVTRCGDPACTWAASRSYLDPAYVGRGPSIAIGTDGLPIVAYRRGSSGALRVTHCGNSGCTAGNISTNFGTGGMLPVSYGGDSSAIAIGADGRPLVAFDWSLSQNLMLLRCSTATCVTAWSTVTVDASTDDVGAYPALAIGIDDLPVMAYLNRTTNTIRVAKCGTLSCG